MNASELQKLTDWLIDGGRSSASPTRFMAETCERMVAAGLPLWRVGVFVRTLHPDILGRNFVWKPGAEADIMTKGRHDPCVGIRAVPVGEAMMACVLADHFLRHRGQVGSPSPG